MKNQFPGSLFHSTGATQEVINLQPERVCKISTARSIQHLFTDNAPGRTFSNRRSGIRPRPSRPCSGAHAQASIAAIELPQGGMAAQNLGFPSLASAPNPPKEDSGPWIPLSSLKTHAEAAAELDGGCGCRGRQVRRLSGDGSGPDPDPGPRPAGGAEFRPLPEAAGNPFSHREDRGEGRTGLGQRRIARDKLREAVYAQLTEPLAKAVAIRPSKNY